MKLDIVALRRILSSERIYRLKESKRLPPLEPGFYQEVNKYLCKLEDASIDSSEAKEELQEASSLAHEIYKKRCEKIIFVVLSALKGGKPDLSNLLPEEKNLYKRIMDTLNAHKEKVFEQRKPPTKGYLLARVLKSIPRFIGPDERIYALSKDDIVSLPEQVARVLESKNKIKFI